MKKLLRIFLVLLLSLFSACAVGLFAGTTPEVQQTLIQVSSRYLESIAAGDEHLALRMVYWPEFVERAGSDLSREAYIRQLHSIRNRWQPKDHPLLRLHVISARQSGNYGEVVLKKEKEAMTPDSPPPTEITINLFWAGNGWVISSDSLFGKGRYLEQLADKTKG